MKKTLYVYRPLINRAEFSLWAKQAEFVNLVAPEELHVTIAHSTIPVDWNLIIPDKKTLIVKNDPRTLAKFGGHNVLKFNSPHLLARFNELRDVGASWDFPNYQPHITFANGNVVPKGFPVYDWPLVFGPEQIEEIK